MAKVSVVAFGAEDESALFNGLQSQLADVIRSGAFGDELNAVANEQGVSECSLCVPRLPSLARTHAHMHARNVSIL